MGTWTLTCPRGGVYEGQCTYSDGKNFSLKCEGGLKTVKEPEGESCTDNPGRRRYLPHGLTECEKAHPKVRRKLSRCIKTLEPRERRGEIESAVAVCRARIRCPP